MTNKTADAAAYCCTATLLPAPTAACCHCCLLPVPTLTPHYVHILQDRQQKKALSLNVRTLTPYSVRTLQDHQKKERVQPQSTYAHALLRTHPTRQPEERKKPASKYGKARSEYRMYVNTKCHKLLARK